MKARITNWIILISAVMVLGACAATADSRSTGQVLDDASIAARVKAALAADDITKAHDIDVEVDRDRVQLNGFVESRAQRDRALVVARDVSGVRSVDNNLEVSAGSRTTGEYIDDKALIVRVKAALADHPVANAASIDVEANRGVVSLGGYVDSSAVRAAAMDAVKGVKGIVRVENNLTVR